MRGDEAQIEIGTDSGLCHRNLHQTSQRLSLNTSPRRLSAATVPVPASIKLRNSFGERSYSTQKCSLGRFSNFATLEARNRRNRRNPHRTFGWLYNWQSKSTVTVLPIHHHPPPHYQRTPRNHQSLPSSSNPICKKSTSTTLPDTKNHDSEHFLKSLKRQHYLRHQTRRSTFRLEISCTSN